MLFDSATIFIFHGLVENLLTDISGRHELLVPGDYRHVRMLDDCYPDDPSYCMIRP
ncbi:hypothetical protein NTGZN8_280032 [Candidatus Nitrotoga fabula]|uniref:Uncharacterized protein n=1 Tax=Candidatus Nitrotoga fabula TaxID=2182327 RepID=A0A916BCP8_9PROT|nr:hypothetical protein NTGZN8_280032 [Candidatus Nitrotoga fabula]